MLFNGQQKKEVSSIITSVIPADHLVLITITSAPHPLSGTLMHVEVRWRIFPMKWCSSTRALCEPSCTYISVYGLLPLEQCYNFRGGKTMIMTVLLLHSEGSAHRQPCSLQINTYGLAFLEHSGSCTLKTPLKMVHGTTWLSPIHDLVEIVRHMLALSNINKKSRMGGVRSVTCMYKQKKLASVKCLRNNILYDNRASQKLMKPSLV